MVKIAFFGSPPPAAATLEALVAAGHEVVLVVSAPDARRGRAGPPVPSPVKQCAISHGLAVSEEPADAARCGAELGVVVAYGRLLRRPLLEALPVVNLHFSLLPRWRGAAPVEAAILAGDARTGVSLMAIDEGLDTGPVYAQRAVDIGPDERAEALTARLGALGTELLLDRLAAGTAGLGTPRAQSGAATYAPKLTGDDLRLDFARPAVELDRVVRAGRAWTTFRGRRLIVSSARHRQEDLRLPPGTLVGDLVATGDGALELVEVHPEGRVALPLAVWTAGARPAPGERLGDGWARRPGRP